MLQGGTERCQGGKVPSLYSDHYWHSDGKVQYFYIPPLSVTLVWILCRFSTGLKFLERLLKAAGEGENGLLAKSIPLSKLWCNLIAVACQHTGHERLKVIHLLLQLLTMMKDRLCGH